MALIVSNYDAAEALIDGGARLSAEGGQKLTQGAPDNKRLNDLVEASADAEGGLTGL